VGRTGTITGTSFWINAAFSLDGHVDEFGNIYMTDDGPSQGYSEIAYLGYVSLGAETPLLGLYFENNNRLGIWGCSPEP
jgi:hypothetical protein